MTPRVPHAAPRPCLRVGCRFRGTDIVPLLAFPALALLPVLAGTLLSSCAILSEDDIPLRYPPDAPPREKIVPGLDDWSAAQIVLLPFDDCRNDTITVGQMTDPATGQLETLAADRSVREWIEEAIVYELRRGGYLVTRADKVPARAGVMTISGDVEVVENTGAFRQGADVSFAVRVSRGGTPMLVQRYIGHGSASSGQRTTHQLYGRSLSLALSEAVHSFIHDLRALDSTVR